MPFAGADVLHVFMETHPETAEAKIAIGKVNDWAVEYLLND